MVRSPTATGPVAWCRGAVAAVGFLTRLPVASGSVDVGELRRATAAFPLVGLLVAGVMVAVRAAVAPWWGQATAAVAAVLAAVAVTGAQHLDGLADTADGLWGGTDRERRLEIMHDSRLGVYGASALFASLALQAVLLAPLDLGGFARAVVVGHVLGRGAIVVTLRTLPPVRSDGQGAALAGPIGPAGSLVAGATVVLALLLTMGPQAWAPVLAGGLTLAAARSVALRRLGGATGDTHGATEQVVELAGMAAVVALLRAGSI